MSLMWNIANTIQKMGRTTAPIAAAPPLNPRNTHGSQARSYLFDHHSFCWATAPFIFFVKQI